MSKAYMNAWVRSGEGFVTPNAGEVAVFYEDQDYTDILAADKFDAMGGNDAIGSYWINSYTSGGGEMYYPKIVRGGA